jgi:ankyrin repeat protein
MSKCSNFHTAILNQDIETAESLLSQDSTPLHETDSGGRTALHLAVISYTEGGSSDVGDQIVQSLLEHGADCSIKDEVFHLSPLSLAERMGVWSAVNLLLQYGADKNDLILTKRYIHNDECVQNLLKEALSRGLIEILKFMFEDFKIDVNYRLDTRNSRGFDIKWTPLMWAANHCNAESVKFLLDKGADIEAHGFNALIVACELEGFSESNTEEP